MKKKDLVKKISDNMQLTQEVSTQIFDTIFDELTEILATDQALTIYGLGTFSCKKMPQRTGYDLSTKSSVTYPAKKKAVFRASSTFKERIQP